MVGRLVRLAGALYLAQLFVILVFLSCGGVSDPASDDDETHQGGASNKGGQSTGGLTGGTRTSGGADSGGSNRGGEAGAGDGGAPGGTAGDPTGGANDGGAGVGGEGGALPVGVCPNPRTWSADLVACEGNYVHRPAPVECALPARDETIPDLPPNAGVEDFENDPACEASLKTCRIEQDDCTRDADCGAGYCVRTTREYMDYDDFEVMLDVHHRCYMPCSTDSDCGTDEVCACAYFTRNATRTSLPVGVCMAADCRMDADCGEGAFCSAPLTQAARGGPATELGPFHCQSPDDECHGPERCPVEDRNFCGNVATCVHNGDHLECGETDPDDNCG